MGAIYKCNQKTMHPPGYHYNSFVATHAHYVRFAMVVYKYIYIYTHIYIYTYIYILYINQPTLQPTFGQHYVAYLPI